MCCRHTSSATSPRRYGAANWMNFLSLSFPVFSQEISQDKPSLCYIYDLPIELFRYILQYLTIPELGKIEGAILNHNLRSHYLRSIHGMEIEYADISTNEIIKFIQQRGIQLQKIEITHLCADKLPLIAQINTKLKYLSLFCNTKQLGDLGLCPLLRQLSISYACIDIKQLLKFLRTNSQLSSVHIDTQSIIPPQLLLNSFQYCTNLQHLDLSSCRWIDDSFIQLFIANPVLQLKSIFLQYTSIRSDEIIQSLLRAYPQLQGITCPKHISKDLEREILTAIIIPSLQCDERERLLIALKCLHVHLQVSV